MRSQDCFAELTETLIRVIHQAAMIEQMPVDIGHGISLTASEIHLIDVAGRCPGENLSSLANRLGVTKGAITQMVHKLEQKGYVSRVKGQENKKTIFLELTGKGTEAFRWHANLHKTLSVEFQENIGLLPEDQIHATIAILNTYEAILQRSLSVRKTVQINAQSGTLTDTD